MTQEYNDPTPARTTKKEVDLFPVLQGDRVPQMAMMGRQQAPDRLGAQISMFNPVTFEEALNIVDCLRTRASATISLENMRKADADRLVDFVSGASAAIDGDFHKLNDNVYLFCPSNMRIIAPGDTAKATSHGGPLDYLFPEGSVFDKSKFTGFNS
ncbi:MAG: cell division protein SepF [Candidatus Obscuribacterales bacterium]|nr:cell division protein SepF [Candidatus Obscuribacterales bacterium]